MAEGKVERVSVTGLLEEIAGELCDHYCRYPDEYTDEDKMIEERCEQCPLMKI